jgi:serine/threonine-protein kinase
VGQLIANRYRLGPLLGRGGMCAVYRAKNLAKQREVAIKILPREKASIEEFARRFQREVTTAKRIDHPNIATISDSGSLDDGSLFLVMELLEGQLLSTLLQSGRLPVKRALAIARQILVGLAEAHRLGIAHRDVKPANVMLLDVNGVETVKLFDFGIASNEKAAVKLTQAGSAFGTPEYISPEMAKGERVDGRADVYAVGVMLFEMLTGKLPFIREDGIALLRAHINEPPPSPRAVAPDAQIGKPLEALILRAMRKDPAERFPTADAMIAAIDAELAGGSRARPLLWVGLALAAAAAAAAWWWLSR